MVHRQTRQRRMILEAVRSRCDHPTVEQIYDQVRESDERISKATVYRNLGLLADEGQITHVTSYPADRYDLRLDKHYHMRCTECSRVWDAPMEYQGAYDSHFEQMTGFRLARHDIVFEGICPDCQQNK